MDEEHKRRMMRHLNTAHQETLVDFVKVHGANSAIKGTCTVIDMDSGGLEIGYTEARSTTERQGIQKQSVKFIKRSTTTSEVRQAVEELRVKAMQELGLPVYPVKTYQFDDTQCLGLIFSIYIIGICIFSIRITPLEAWFHSSCLFRYRYAIVVALFLVRWTEYLILLRPLLNSHRVPPDMQHLWKLANFSCGLTTFQAFLKLAEETRRAGTRRTS
ncbi:hypothetical protein FRC19_003409 [Serendipita sp. 401]|nr:hypothetical protein FRC19_003409 [Serendipita sp. 401]